METRHNQAKMKFKKAKLNLETAFAGTLFNYNKLILIYIN